MAFSVAFVLDAEALAFDDDRVGVVQDALISRSLSTARMAFSVACNSRIIAFSSSLVILRSLARRERETFGMPVAARPDGLLVPTLERFLAGRPDALLILLISCAMRRFASAKTCIDLRESIVLDQGG